MNISHLKLSSYGYAGLGGFAAAAPNPFGPFGANPFANPYSPYGIAGAGGLPSPFSAYGGYSSPFGLSGYGAMPYNYAAGFGAPQYSQPSKCPNCPYQS